MLSVKDKGGHPSRRSQSTRNMLQADVRLRDANAPTNRTRRNICSILMSTCVRQKRVFPSPPKLTKWAAERTINGTFNPITESYPWNSKRSLRIDVALAFACAARYGRAHAEKARYICGKERERERKAERKPLYKLSSTCVCRRMEGVINARHIGPKAEIRFRTLFPRGATIIAQNCAA